MSKNFYDVLGIQKDASEGDIRKAYKKLAIKYHPDKGGDEEKFKEISEAYSVLSDSQKRQNYDRFGTVDNNGMNMNDFQDIFSNMFGGFNHGPFGNIFGGKPKAVKTKEIKLYVTLEEVFQGKCIPYRLLKKSWKFGTKCKYCEGKGRTVEMMQMGPMITQNVRECVHCQGLGEIYEENKAIIEEKIIDIPLPKGIHNQQRLAIRGEGDQYGSEKAGDVIVTILHKPHFIFETSKDNPNDLIYKCSLPFEKFLFGFEKKIKHLDGNYLEIVACKCPFENIEGNMNKILHGKGMSYRGQTGNLIIQFSISLPKPKIMSEIQSKYNIEKPVFIGENENRVYIAK
jgi:DnaJ family protein A protein 2